LRGRKPKPSHLRLVQGNAGHRPINQKEPKPKGDLTKPPEWLSDDQKQIWNDVIADAPKGLLKKLDGSVLTVWVVACSIHRRMAEKVNAGLVLAHTPAGMPVVGPYMSILNRQSAIMVKAASELGFSPSARTRIQVEDDADEDDTQRFFR
jgi:P27 family predicted phage terminase small subunit